MFLLLCDSWEYSCRFRFIHFLSHFRRAAAGSVQFTAAIRIQILSFFPQPQTYFCCCCYILIPCIFGLHILSGFSGKGADRARARVGSWKVMLIFIFIYLLPHRPSPGFSSQLASFHFYFGHRQQSEPKTTRTRPSSVPSATSALTLTGGFLSIYDMYSVFNLHPSSSFSFCFLLGTGHLLISQLEHVLFVYIISPILTCLPAQLTH